MSTAAEQPPADLTTIEFPAAEGFRGVGRLVLGGIASRFELPVDRVADLLLAVESLFLQISPAGRLRIEAEASATGLVVRVGPFAPGQASDPAVHRVVSRLVDDVRERVDGDGSARVELVVAAPYRA